MQKDVNTIFLNLVKLGIGHYAGALDESVCWKEIQNLAEEHGLYAVVLDGIERLPKSSRPNQEFLLEWIGEVLQDYEYRYEQYCKAICELAGFYNSHGYKMMVLKGYACSLNWPIPQHRPCGDIDIWLFGKRKEADALLKREKGIHIDTSHHHHSVFDWNDFTVENHFDFVNVYAESSSRQIEKIFKQLGKDDSCFVEVRDDLSGTAAKIYLPSPNLHALFLIKHMISHFAAAEINMRQVLDWAFFVEKHTKEIDWKWLDGMLEKFNMKDFVNCINGICVEELGFDAGIFQEVKFLPALKDRILDDILKPEYTSAEPKGIVRRIIYKYKRWQGNAWKQRLCYKDSRLSMLFNGIWAKVLKPSSI